MNKSYMHTNRKQNVIHQAFSETKRFNNSHPEIIITEPDKGNITILMLKEEYNSRLDSYYSNTNKFNRLTSDPISTLEVKNNTIIRPPVQRKLHLKTKEK